VSSTSDAHTEAQLRVQGLQDGTSRLAVWGLGYIGLSTAEAFADAGVSVEGHDIDLDRVQAISALELPRISASAVVDNVLTGRCTVHMVAVPSEREGQPYDDALLSVAGTLARAIQHGELAGVRPLVVIESTLTPGTFDRLVLPVFAHHGLEIGHDLLLGLAPRRDWFLAEGYGLRELDRVYAGSDEQSADAIRAVLSLVNDTLHRAADHRVGELVKCVENAYRHMDITLANELSLAFPDVDMVEVLRLAGTKWNIGTYHPSFGTGGYCIPLSSRYLLRGAQHPDALHLLSATVERDDQMRLLVADAVADAGPVVILGVAYKGGIKVDILSPAKAIVARLTELGVPVVVHDPMYSSAELDRILGSGLTTDDLPAAIRAAGTVLIIPDHPEFLGDEYIKLLNEPRTSVLTVLDNHGVLANVSWSAHVRYKRAGSPRWLEAQEPTT
jgi:nucleotide sugar dehydrogenase